MRRIETVYITWPKDQVFRAMTLDENIYTKPHQYNPARFLPKPEGNGEPLPTGPFGFGRRYVPLLRLESYISIHSGVGYVLDATLPKQPFGLP